MSVSFNKAVVGLLVAASVAGCVGPRQGKPAVDGIAEVVDISISTATAENPAYMGWPKYFDYAPTKVSPQEPMLNTPEFASGKPWFDSIYLGTDQENPYSFAVDIAPEIETSRQAHLYFDANNDGVFNDTECFSLHTMTSMGKSLVFEPITANVVIGDALVERHLRFAIYGQDPARYRLQLFMSDYVEATLRLRNKTYPMRIIDQSKNGLFSDTAVERMAQGDHVLLNPAGGGLGGAYGLNGDIWLLGDTLFFNGAGIRLIPQHMGGELTIQVEKIKAAPVEFALPEFCLTLLDGVRRSAVIGSRGTAAVARGRYELLSYQAEMTDGEGDRWSVQWGRNSVPIPVNTRKRELVFGPPYRASIEARPYKGFIGLGVVITGRAGERYSLNDFRKNDAPIIPHVQIVDSYGAVLAAGPSLVHGSDYFSYSFQWYPNKTRTGSYTAVPVVDYGPLEMSVESLDFDVGALLKGSR